MSISAGLIFKEGVSPLEKWVRRAVVIGIWCIAEPICLWLFGHFDHSCGHTNYKMLMTSTLITTLVVIAVFIVCYIIGDSLEKKHLEIINKKLCEKSFFDSFEKESQLIKTTETYTEHSFEYDSVKYTVLKVLKKAGKHTVIRLEGENVLWEQFYPLGNHPAKDEWVVAKKSFPEKGTVGMIVINGTPLRICGLDENGYVSVNKKIKTDRDVYVLTCDELKTFEP
ncbi:MAG: hypothetical protein IKL24_00400 [Clostridia bacterium]|nr:hypothetical protein [Clostridia bacterium]